MILRLILKYIKNILFSEKYVSYGFKNIIIIMYGTVSNKNILFKNYVYDNND